MAEFFAVYSGYLIAAVTLVAALLIFVLVYRAIGGKVRGRRGQRLGISEYHEIDKTRRLVLVRRDEVEHLILIGGSGDDVVIETGIADTPSIPDGSAAALFRKSLNAKRTAREQEDEKEEAVAPSRPAPRPPVFGDRVPAKGLRRDEPRLSPGPAYAAEKDDA